MHALAGSFLRGSPWLVPTAICALSQALLPLPSADAGKYQHARFPSETPADFKTDPRRLRLRPARRDDPDARRREAAHRHPGAEGREGRADPADAHALRRRRADDATPQSAHLGPILYGYDNATEVIVEGGYIRVVQDVRGKYGSEGDYVMNRPLRGPLNPTPVDHATDTYDTIDWLVKNVPESNGKVGHPRHLLRRIPAADGAGQSASRAQGVGADEPDGRRLDGRRLVPQRRLPPAEHALHLRAGRPRATTTSKWWTQPLRRLRHVHAGRIGGRARAAARPGADRLLAQAPRASELRRVLARSGGGQAAGARSRSRCR